MRMQPRPEKLTTEELGQIAGLDAAKLDMLAAWANKKLTCAHCKRCTLRCEVLKEPQPNGIYGGDVPEDTCYDWADG